MKTLPSDAGVVPPAIAPQRFISSGLRASLIAGGVMGFGMIFAFTRATEWRPSWHHFASFPLGMMALVMVAGKIGDRVFDGPATPKAAELCAGCRQPATTKGRDSGQPLCEHCAKEETV